MFSFYASQQKNQICLYIEEDTLAYRELFVYNYLKIKFSIFNFRR
jgi:hypothetical protein